MESEVESEEIFSSEISHEEAVDLNEESFEDFAEIEEVYYELSEEASTARSKFSVFTEGSIESYKSPERIEEEIIPEDSLMPVPTEHYPDMLFLMANDFPKAIHAYEHVRSLIKWKKTFPKHEIQILAPEGDYKNGIFFFSINHGNFYGSAYCHEKTDKSILVEALAASRYLPAQEQYNLCRIICLNPYTFETIKNNFSKKNWCKAEDVVLWLPWYCAREIEVHLPNKDVKIRKLGIEHIDLIHESWQENFPGSRELLGDMFDVQDGLGLFEENSLLSWALVWYHGGIGIIQTIEREKGKGYCRPVVESLTQRMGHYLIDVHLKIGSAKKRDIVFFSNLGFRYAFKAISYETKKSQPKKKTETKRKTLSFKKDQRKSQLL